MGIVIYVGSLAVCFIIFILLKNKISTNRLPPGPWGLPFVGYVPFLGENPHQTMIKLATKYGNTFSIQLGRKKVVVLNDYPTIKDVLSRSEVLYKLTDTFATLGDCGHLSSNGEAWVQQRKLFMQVLKDIGVGKEHWNNLVKEEASSIVKMLTKINGDPVDIEKALIESTVITVTAICTGKKLQKGVDDDILEMLQEYPRRSLMASGTVSVLSTFPGIQRFLEFFNIGGYGELSKMIQKVDMYFDEEVKNRATQNALHSLRDLINGYKEKFEEKIPDSLKDINLDKHISASIKLSYLAISETTASAMDWLFRLMALHQSVQDKVHEELDRLLVDDWCVTYEQRYLVPYTSATIMETLRYAAILPLLPSRCTTADIKVRDFILPKGTEVTGNVYAVHHNPQYWENPDKFEPQRFLTEHSTIVRNPTNFVPFSVGRRNCPGDIIAYMSMMIYFTAVMKKFRIESPPDQDVNIATIPGLIRKVQAQSLCFIERQHIVT